MLPRSYAPSLTWPPRRHWLVAACVLATVVLLTSMPERDPNMPTLPMQSSTAVRVPSVDALRSITPLGPTAASIDPPAAPTLPSTASPTGPPVPSPTPGTAAASLSAAPSSASLLWVASSWLTALIVLMAGAAAYLLAVLPTLEPRRALAATGGACAALTLAGLSLAAWADAGMAGSAMATLLVAFPALALVSGHGGFVLGRRRRTPSRQRPSGTLRVVRPTLTPPDTGAALADVPADRTLFGNFRIEGDLGRGAMGMVRLGRHQRTGQQVALKTLSVAAVHDDQGDVHEAKRRFLREAALATRLRHPDIVAIVGSGEAHGQAYIAMEYVEGHDLCRHTRSDALLPLPVLLDAMARVAEALAHAHMQGVVHRDIKPSNLMWNPQTRQIKVADFGVARVADGSRTSTGVLIGTPTYLAPEQLAGRKVDHRTDLYALGVTMFQLITGQAPQRAESMARLMYAIANVPAPDVRRLRPDAPPELAAIVAQLLEKEPDDRYEDGRALAADLRAVPTASAAIPDKRE